MACTPLIDSDFVAAVTGADVSDTDRVDTLIQVLSDLIGDDLGACLDPDTASMRHKVVCAEFVADALKAGSSDPVKAEQVGDYRVEYAGAGRGFSIDLDALHRALRAGRKGAYSVSTFDKPATDSTWEEALWESTAS